MSIFNFCLFWFLNKIERCLLHDDVDVNYKKLVAYPTLSTNIISEAYYSKVLVNSLLLII